MKNTNYAPEMASAMKWIINHSYDGDLHWFLTQLRETVGDPDYTHSDRWSWTYDWMKEHYPEVTGSIITGIVYAMEE